jgi:hypothetical protein
VWNVADAFLMNPDAEKGAKIVAALQVASLP